MDAAQLAADVARHRWYHTIELGQGVVTSGMFDHRGVLDRYLLPADTRGLRCLDVGTMDGFWAFELERRGSEEVVAVDVDDPDELDWPPAEAARVTDRELDHVKAERFALAHRALGSRVQRRICSVYDLDPAELGTFDLVFCGDLLVHLKDPITALQRMLGVCRGTMVVCTPVERLVRWGRRRPLAELDGIDHFRWWNLSEAALERMVRAVGFVDVERGRSFELPTTDATWRGLRGVVAGRAPRRP